MLQASGSNTAHMAALQLAVVFMLSMLIARMSSKMKYMPKVTAYLLVGLALSASGFLSPESVKSMGVLKEIALSLILFLVGTEFRMKSLAQGITSSLKLTSWDVALTLVVTGGSTMLAALVTDMDQAITIGILLGIFAIEIGPASTLAVLREHNSHGPYTDYLKLTVANANTAALILFAVAAVFVFPSDDGGIQRSLAESAWWLLVPIPVGVVLGLFLAWVETFEKKPALRLLVMLAVLMGAIGLSKSLSISQILTIIMAGFAYANGSTRGQPVLETVRILETPFYVIFFVYAGASLHLEELPKIGLVGIIYVIARTISRYFGTYIGAKQAGHPKDRRKLLGASVLSHSAIVLALLEVIKGRVGGDDYLYSTLQTLILGSVVVFEVFGPIFVKVCALKSGEVSIVNAVPHKSKVIVGNQLINIIKTFLDHLGLHEKDRERTLASFVIEDSHALEAASGFDKLTKFIEHYPYDSFPVVNSKGIYIGFISFNEIKDASYDPIMKDLVRAADLMATEKPIDLDHDTIDSAYERIRDLTITSLPVIRHDEEGNSLLVGVVLQRDLTAAHVSSAGDEDTRQRDSQRMKSAPQPLVTEPAKREENGPI